MKIQLSGSQFKTAIKWCNDNISCRKYYLHNRLGGVGWEVSQQEGRWVASINDEQLAFLFTMKFSK